MENSTNQLFEKYANKDEKKILKNKKKKKYEEYTSQFTPKPRYAINSIMAFITGGIICMIALYIQNTLQKNGIDEKSAGTFVTVLLICAAQLLTGIGIFDSITKFAGAGVIVPITGFANSMVAPAIEYKKEGIVLGVGSKLFSLAGPVLVAGFFTSTVIGLIYYFVG